MNWNAPEFWVDGGCRGNHDIGGPRAAYGSISDGQDVERSTFYGIRTNNEAEYMVLMTLLTNLRPGQGPIIYTDSRLIVGQLTQGWRVRAPNLLEFHRVAADELGLTGARLVWVPRAQIVARLGH